MEWHASDTTVNSGSRSVPKNKLFLGERSQNAVLGGPIATLRTHTKQQVGTVIITA